MGPWYKDVRNPLGFVVLFFAAFGGMLLYAHFTEGPKAADAQARLEAEFKTVPSVPGAALTDYSAYHKESIAAVEGSYRTTVDYRHIADYYSAQLPVHGWRSCGETTTTGQHQLRATYSKQDLEARVYLATSPSPQAEWIYSVVMSWYLDPALRTPCQ